MSNTTNAATSLLGFRSMLESHYSQGLTTAVSKDEFIAKGLQKVNYDTGARTALLYCSLLATTLPPAAITWHPRRAV